MTEENEAPSQPVSPSGEIETREAGCICIEAHPGSADRAGLWEMVPECPVHGASDHDCAPFTTAPVSSGGQADGVGEGCPTCSGPFRETVGMVCQTCGTDYAPADPGIPLGTVRRASQAFLMAQSDYLGQDLAFMDAPMRAALAAARPVLSREALARAWWIQEAVDGGSDRAWAEAAWDDMGGSEPTDERAEYEIRADAVLGVLTAGGEQDG